MTRHEKIKIIERLDLLIKRKATGTPASLSKRLNLSESSVFNLLKMMKEDLNGPIKYCKDRQTYYYEYEVQLVIGFISKRKINQ